LPVPALQVAGLTHSAVDSHIGNEPDGQDGPFSHVVPVNLLRNTFVQPGSGGFEAVAWAQQIWPLPHWAAPWHTQSVPPSGSGPPASVAVVQFAAQYETPPPLGVSQQCSPKAHVSLPASPTPLKGQ
jgi:hypothetical protein